MKRGWLAIQKYCPWLEFGVAATVAAFFMARKTHKISDLWSHLPRLGAALLRQETTLGPDIAQLRLHHCATRCPIFYAPLRTCGTPLHGAGYMLLHPDTQFGCWCHMPTKARGVCNCWLYDMVQGRTDGSFSGWPHELNSAPFAVNIPIHHAGT